MKKKVRRSSTLILSLLFLSGIAVAKESPEAKAARIHKSVLTIDTHCDTPLNLTRDGFDAGKRNDMAAKAPNLIFRG